MLEIVTYLALAAFLLPQRIGLTKQENGWCIEYRPLWLDFLERKLTRKESTRVKE